MGWEEGIMRLSVEKLAEGMKGEDGEGLRVLNVGFGLGIVSKHSFTFRVDSYHHPEAVRKSSRSCRTSSS